jgi:hypothetical protein
MRMPRLLNSEVGGKFDLALVANGPCCVRVGPAVPWQAPACPGRPRLWDYYRPTRWNALANGSWVLVPQSLAAASLRFVSSAPSLRDRQR